jgi:hypothetical protein
MFSRGEGEVVNMDLYILSFCISIFAGRRFMGTVFASWGVGLVGINDGGEQLGGIPISMGRVKMGKEYEKGGGPAQYLHQIYLWSPLMSGEVHPWWGSDTCEHIMTYFHWTTQRPIRNRFSQYFWC